uniref:Carbohydrate sulfotransferase n=1 Tax=Rhabditophanes sp. KR3021 TaxID=114890 RepID=A0AC35U1F9_9BILA
MRAVVVVICFLNILNYSVNAFNVAQTRALFVRNEKIPGPKQCIKPFVNLKKIQHRFLVSKKYKFNFCAINKNFSTILQAIICYLSEPAQAKSANNIVSYNWAYSYCPVSSIKTSMTQIANENSDGKLPQLFRTFKHYVIVREPIERFVSGFVDKCIFEAKNNKRKSICFGCKQNLSCFIKKLHNRLFNEATREVSPKKFYYYDSHFYPQSWECHVSDYSKNYKIIKFSSAKAQIPAFHSKILKILEERKVPKAKRDFIYASISSKKTSHSHADSKITQSILNQIIASPELQEYLYLMYFKDYEIFNFQLPTFMKKRKQ